MNSLLGGATLLFVNCQFFPQLCDESILVFEHLLHVLDCCSLVDLHVQLLLCLGQLLLQIFVLHTIALRKFCAFNLLLEFDDLLLQRLVLLESAFILNDNFFNFCWGAKHGKLSVGSWPARQCEVLVHHQFFEVFHVLESLVVFHEVHVCSDH